MTRSLSTPRTVFALPRGQHFRASNRKLDVLAQAFALLLRQQPQVFAPPPLPQFLTLKHAAEYVGLSEQFLRKLIQATKLPMLVDGGVVKVRRVHLDNLPSVAVLAKCTQELRKRVQRRKASAG